MENRKRRLLYFLLIFCVIALLVFLALNQIINFNIPTSEPALYTPLPSFSTPEPSESVESESLIETPLSVEGAEVSKPAVFPDERNYEWGLFAIGFERPVDFAHANDGSGRLFIVEQAGVVRVLYEGKILDQAFLDIQELIDSSSNEQGLLGIAFHPDYLLNGYFYLNYTNQNGSTEISRFQVSADPNIADPSSELKYLTISQPYTNHNGGGMAFGPDGFLYVGTGDGGLYGDPQGNAQNLNSNLGKLLRFDVDGDGLPELWAVGLRNPWRFSFDSVTDALYLADVGQNEFEEINYLPAKTAAGSNFGWDYYEGLHSYEGNPPNDLVFVFPVAEYEHKTGGCSVTGGNVYRGQEFPEWQGIYFYGDFCSGNVWGLFQNAIGTWESKLLFQLSANISSFGVDELGELYIVDLLGNLLKLQNK